MKYYGVVKFYQPVVFRMDNQYGWVGVLDIISQGVAG